jgi:hypothetical protein
MGCFPIKLRNRPLMRRFFLAREVCFPGILAQAHAGQKKGRQPEGLAAESTGRLHVWETKGFRSPRNPLPTQCVGTTLDYAFRYHAGLVKAVTTHAKIA